MASWTSWPRRASSTGSVPATSARPPVLASGTASLASIRMRMGPSLLLREPGLVVEFLAPTDQELGHESQRRVGAAVFQRDQVIPKQTEEGKPIFGLVEEEQHWRALLVDPLHPGRLPERLDCIRQGHPCLEEFRAESLCTRGRDSLPPG